MESRRLMKSEKNKVISGVCGGIGDYFDIDPVIVRVLWVLFAMTGGSGVLAYIVFSLIMPEYNEHYVHPERKESKQERDRNSTNLLAIALLVFGAGSLADHFIPWFDWKIVVPAGMLLIGFYLLVQHKNTDDDAQ
jgi:phage shock protein C